MSLQPWKKLSSQDILRNRWIRLRADRCEVAPGRIIDAYYVLEEPAWVHVVAFAPDHRVLLVRQYRHAIAAFAWELPGGTNDPGEELLATARRELAEETGATGEDWRHLGGYVTNPGRHDNYVHGFLARHVRVVAAPTPDGTEAFESAFFTVDEVFGLIRSGEFSSAMHVALFYRALEALGWLRVAPHSDDR